MAGAESAPSLNEALASYRQNEICVAMEIMRMSRVNQLGRRVPSATRIRTAILGELA